MHVLCNNADDWTLKEENSKCGQNHSWAFCQNAPHRETRWICSWIQLDKRNISFAINSDSVEYHYCKKCVGSVSMQICSVIAHMCWILQRERRAFNIIAAGSTLNSVQITSLMLRRGSEQIKACHSFEAAACIVLCWSIVVSCLQFHCVGWLLQIVLVVDGTARQISCLHLSPSSSAAAGTHRALLLCKQLSLVC